jgi:hypothetical protein
MWPFAAQIGVATPEQFVMASQKLLKLMGVEDAEKYISMPQMPAMGGMPFGVGGGQSPGGVMPPGIAGGAVPAGAGGAVGIPQ